jgi:hypothetical protein
MLNRLLKVQRKEKSNEGRREGWEETREEKRRGEQIKKENSMHSGARC